MSNHFFWYSGKCYEWKYEKIELDVGSKRRGNAMSWMTPPPQKKSINKTYRTINSYECGIVKFHQKPRLRQWILTLEWNFTIPHEYVIKGYFLYIILHKCDFWQFFYDIQKLTFGLSFFVLQIVLVEKNEYGNLSIKIWWIVVKKAKE